jgi:hypothetical protein
VAAQPQHSSRAAQGGRLQHMAAARQLRQAGEGRPFNPCSNEQSCKCFGFVLPVCLLRMRSSRQKGVCRLFAHTAGRASHAVPHRLHPASSFPSFLPSPSASNLADQNINLDDADTISQGGLSSGLHRIPSTAGGASSASPAVTAGEADSAFPAAANGEAEDGEDGEEPPHKRHKKGLSVHFATEEGQQPPPQQQPEGQAGPPS